jgi:transcriptional regulator with XRE-family HTH domain
MKKQNLLTMKQPELGKKISELRKAKGYTQEELVEKCNLNVRTIQRIETGEVTPRSYTVKAIFTALGYDYTAMTNIEASASTSKFLKLAWIFGIVYFFAGFFEFAAEYYRFEQDRMIYSNSIYIIVKLIVLASFSMFIYGFIIIGLLFKNYILKIISFIFLTAFVLSIFYDIFSLNFEILPYEIVLTSEAITFGCIQLIFGIALLKLIKNLGNVALAAGILEILTGVLFITVLLALLGLITYTPAIVFEIIILYKTAELIKSDTL